jgi:hypothetical protein
MFRPIARWFVVVVLALDAVAAFLYIGTSLFETSAAVPAAVVEAKPAPAPAVTLAPASASAPAPAPTSAQPVAPTEPAPSTTTAAIPATTIPGAVNPAAPVAAAVPSSGATGATAAAKEAPKSEAFLRLLHAYENMEPESAAKAIAELAAKDKEAVVQMMLGWKPRTSGQILDALTQFNPKLAAELSYEVWKRGNA